MPGLHFLSWQEKRRSERHVAPRAPAVPASSKTGDEAPVSVSPRKSPEKSEHPPRPCTTHADACWARHPANSACWCSSACLSLHPGQHALLLPNISCSWWITDTLRASAVRPLLQLFLADAFGKVVVELSHRFLPQNKGSSVVLCLAVRVSGDL